MITHPCKILDTVPSMLPFGVSERLYFYLFFSFFQSVESLKSPPHPTPHSSCCLMLLLACLLIKSSARWSSLCFGRMKGMSQQSVRMRQGRTFRLPPTGFALFWCLSFPADPHIWSACLHLCLQKQQWQSRIKGTVTTKSIKHCFPCAVRNKLVQNTVLPEFFCFNVYLLMFEMPFWDRPDFSCSVRHAVWSCLAYSQPHIGCSSFSFVYCCFQGAK